jgi:hypothetical protein
MISLPPRYNIEIYPNRTFVKIINPVVMDQGKPLVEVFNKEENISQVKLRLGDFEYRLLFHFNKQNCRRVRGPFPFIPGRSLRAEKARELANNPAEPGLGLEGHQGPQSCR